MRRAINLYHIGSTSLKVSNQRTAQENNDIPQGGFCVEGRWMLAYTRPTTQKKDRALTRSLSLFFRGGHWIRTRGYLTISAV